MPRETRPPHDNAQTKGILSPQKAPTKLPLNDDRAEKAVRFQSRQAIHEMQMNQIKAAATPVRRRKSLLLPGSGSPRTPSGLTQGNEGSPGLAVVGSAVTPMKRVPILANFEEWMKMATDNKINAANSWNFALIDYFHDMSLLKEGDGVNFQKASCTLDGCVKIYTSRVDSVATETGKLLSGLADSGNKKRKGEDGDEAQGEEEDEEGEDGAKKKSKKRVRSEEATLATSFTQLQLKKMELEFSVDPLFKKASADFDEGGAKGLLLNHLTIDARGRIVFDSSDNAQQKDGTGFEIEPTKKRGSAGEDINNTRQDTETQAADIDLDLLAQKFFPDLSRLDDQDICPSLKSFELEGFDAALKIPFLKAPDDFEKDHTPINKHDNGDSQNREHEGILFQDDDDGGVGGCDLVDDIGFGEGGEAWANEAVTQTQPAVYNITREQNIGEGNENEVEDVGCYKPDIAHYTVKMIHEKGMDRENIFGYFDQALQLNWAGPEHWRIRKIKDITKAPSRPGKRKEKEPFEIDFAAPLTHAAAAMLYTSATSYSAICLPKAQWKSRTKNLLPDDKHFNSQQLLRLFLKPKARIGSGRENSLSKQGPAQDHLPEGEMDENFWARTQTTAISTAADPEAPQGNYDANFFEDNGLGLPALPDDEDDDFADTRERLTPCLEGVDQFPGSLDNGPTACGSQEDGFGTQLVTQSRRLRPEYVQYARVAKKVDVRRLKEEMWRGLGLDESLRPPQIPLDLAAAPLAKEEDRSLKFTSVMKNLQLVYPKQAMADISTSYCFICLLHLANEKGLMLSNEVDYQEIMIQKDHTADIADAGE